MTLIQYNKKIRELNEKDPNNEELYQLLHDVTVDLILAKQYQISDVDRDAVAYTLAGDIWMKMMNGSYFKFVTLYIDRVCLRYIQQHVGTFRRIERLVDPVEYDILIETFPEDNSSVVFDDVLNRIYLKNASAIVKQLMGASPYYEGTPLYLNFELSLVLSLYKEKPFNYHLDKFDEDIVRLFIVNFYSKIRTDLK